MLTNMLLIKISSNTIKVPTFAAKFQSDTQKGGSEELQQSAILKEGGIQKLNWATHHVF